jgi:hypothetical protein
LFVPNPTAESPSLSTCSSNNNDEHMKSPTPPLQYAYKSRTPTPPINNNNQPKQQTITFFPELHRTSYNTILGKQLKQHQKRRRSSSLPPAFHNVTKPAKIPTPLIFTQIQVTDPTPVHHTQKAAKIDAKPIAIERAPKKKPVVVPVVCDPVETQKKLDEALLQLNFEDVTVAELKEMLRERGLSSTGKKAVLTDRLKDARDQLRKKDVPNKKVAVGENSPNIQGLANMTIHSPCPPQELLFSPMQDQLTESSASYPYQQPDDLDINGKKKKKKINKKYD